MSRNVYPLVCRNVRVSALAEEDVTYFACMNDVTYQAISSCRVYWNRERFRQKLEQYGEILLVEDAELRPQLFVLHRAEKNDGQVYRKLGAIGYAMDVCSARVRMQLLQAALLVSLKQWPKDILWLEVPVGATAIERLLCGRHGFEVCNERSLVEQLVGYSGVVAGEFTEVPCVTYFVPAKGYAQKILLRQNPG